MDTLQNPILAGIPLDCSTRLHLFPARKPDLIVAGKSLWQFVYRKRQLSVMLMESGDPPQKGLHISKRWQQPVFKVPPSLLLVSPTSSRWQRSVPCHLSNQVPNQVKSIKRRALPAVIGAGGCECLLCWLTRTLWIRGKNFDTPSLHYILGG